MKTEIMPFEYNRQTLRTIADESGNPWFVLADVCAVLDLSNSSMVASRLDEDERSKLNLGRQGDATIINESGLYTVILRSDKPQAKPFRKWVTGEVLPSIRKTGSYQTSQPTQQQTAITRLQAAGIAVKHQVRNENTVSKADQVKREHSVLKSLALYGAVSHTWFRLNRANVPVWKSCGSHSAITQAMHETFDGLIKQGVIVGFDMPTQPPSTVKAYTFACMASGEGNTQLPHINAQTRH